MSIQLKEITIAPTPATYAAEFFAAVSAANDPTKSYIYESAGANLSNVRSSAFHQGAKLGTQEAKSDSTFVTEADRAAEPEAGAGNSDIGGAGDRGSGTGDRTGIRIRHLQRPRRFRPVTWPCDL